MRASARVAGVLLAGGSAVGLAASFGWLGASAFVPGVGEAVAAAAGLYLVGDWAYHNTHQIAHTFDSARHTASHAHSAHIRRQFLFFNHLDFLGDHSWSGHLPIMN